MLWLCFIYQRKGLGDTLLGFQLPTSRGLLGRVFGRKFRDFSTLMEHTKDLIHAIVRVCLSLLYPNREFYKDHQWFSNYAVHPKKDLDLVTKL